MANSEAPSNMDVHNMGHSTYKTVLEASPGALFFGKDVLFDITSQPDRSKIGNKSNIKMILIQNKKTKDLIMIIKLVINYYY